MTCIPWSHETMRIKAIASNGQIESRLPEKMEGEMDPFEPIFETSTHGHVSGVKRLVLPWFWSLILSFLFLHKFTASSKPGWSAEFLTRRPFPRYLLNRSIHQLEGACSSAR
jgi:hypothetical protein